MTVMEDSEFHAVIVLEKNEDLVRSEFAVELVL